MFQRTEVAPTGDLMQAQATFLQQRFRLGDAPGRYRILLTDVRTGLQLAREVNFHP